METQDQGQLIKNEAVQAEAEAVVTAGLSAGNPEAGVEGPPSPAAPAPREEKKAPAPRKKRAKKKSTSAKKSTSPAAPTSSAAPAEKNPGEESQGELPLNGPNHSPGSPEKSAKTKKKKAAPNSSSKSGAVKGNRRTTPGQDSIPDDINKKHELYQLFVMQRELARSTIGPWLASLFRIHTSGFENVPKTGGAILVCNHASYLDPLIKGLYFPRTVTFLAMSDLFTIKNQLMKLYNELGTITGIPTLWSIGKPFVEIFSSLLGDGVKTQLLELKAVPIVRNYRGGSSKDAMEYYNDIRKQMLDLLKEDRIVAIFPEGGRTRSGDLLEFKGMAASLALESGKPIIPAGIKGTFDALDPSNLISGQSFLREINYNIGVPITPDTFPTEGGKKQKVRALTDLMRERIADLLK